MVVRFMVVSSLYVTSSDEASPRFMRAPLILRESLGTMVVRFRVVSSADCLKARLQSMLASGVIV